MSSTDDVDAASLPDKQDAARASKRQRDKKHYQNKKVVIKEKRRKKRQEQGPEGDREISRRAYLKKKQTALENKEKIHNLQAQVAACQRHVDFLTRQLEEANSRLNRMSESVQQCPKENISVIVPDGVSGRCEVPIQQRQKQKEKLQLLQSSNESLRTSLDQSNTENEEMKKRVAELESELELSKLAAEANKNEVESLTTEVQTDHDNGSNAVTPQVCNQFIQLLAGQSGTPATASSSSSRKMPVATAVPVVTRPTTSVTQATRKDDPATCGREKLQTMDSPTTTSYSNDDESSDHDHYNDNNYDDDDDKKKKKKRTSQKTKKRKQEKAVSSNDDNHDRSDDKDDDDGMEDNQGKRIKSKQQGQVVKEKEPTR